MSSPPREPGDSWPVGCLPSGGAGYSWARCPCCPGPLAPLGLDRAQRPRQLPHSPQPRLLRPEVALPSPPCVTLGGSFCPLCLSFHICKGGAVPVLSLGSTVCPGAAGQTRRVVSAVSGGGESDPPALTPAPWGRPLGRVSVCLSFPVCSSTPTPPRAFWGSQQVASPSACNGGRSGGLRVSAATG